MESGKVPTKTWRDTKQGLHCKTEECKTYEQTVRRHVQLPSLGQCLWASLPLAAWSRRRTCPAAIELPE